MEGKQANMATPIGEILQLFVVKALASISRVGMWHIQEVLGMTA
jgi:hypothetical protein